MLVIMSSGTTQNLDDCSPITARYEFATNIANWEKSATYNYTTWHAISPANVNGTVDLTCDVDSWGYVYEVHYVNPHLLYYRKSSDICVYCRKVFTAPRCWWDLDSTTRSFLRDPNTFVYDHT
jgi:hypothetical protein